MAWCRASWSLSIQKIQINVPKRFEIIFAFLESLAVIQVVFNRRIGWVTLIRSWLSDFIVVFGHFSIRHRISHFWVALWSSAFGRQIVERKVLIEFRRQDSSWIVHGGKRKLFFFILLLRRIEINDAIKR